MTITTNDDGTLTVDGRRFIAEPQDATPEPAPLGEPWVPEGGYYYVDGMGDVCEELWCGCHVDRARLQFGNAHRTEAEAIAYRDRNALMEKALRVRDAIWATEPCYIGPHTRYSPTADGNAAHDAGCEIMSPWNFGTTDGCRHFIAAMGDDLRTLLTLDP